MKFRRRLIERQHAARHMFTMIAAFAATVLGTRIFLHLTGYPQIGDETLHIAHVLWGGLIVAVGAALPLIYSNTSIYDWSAALSGIGLGLFFDEVGKFLTQDNDYFFRPAASIIYLLFLLGIYIYITLRRGEPDTQTRLHHVLALLQEVVDGDLDPREKAEIEDMLEGIIGDADLSDARELATHLLEFVEKEADTVEQRRQPIGDAVRAVTAWLERSVLTQRATRWLLVFSTGLLGVISLLDLFSFARAFGDTQEVLDLLEAWAQRGNLGSAQESTWFAVMIGLKVVVGVTLLAALIYFILGNDQRGIGFALVGLLISVTVFDVLLFYFAQFVAAARATLDFVIIAALSFYNARYVTQSKTP